MERMHKEWWYEYFINTARRNACDVRELLLRVLGEERGERVERDARLGHVGRGEVHEDVARPQVHAAVPACAPTQAQRELTQPQLRSYATN